jgi:hypothetical protein
MTESSQPSTQSQLDANVRREESGNVSVLSAPVAPLIQVVTKGWWPKAIAYTTVEALEKEDRE